jgi:hypothetical protein
LHLRTTAGPEIPAVTIWTIPHPGLHRIRLKKQQQTPWLVWDGLGVVLGSLFLVLLLSAADLSEIGRRAATFMACACFSVFLDVVVWM